MATSSLVHTQETPPIVGKGHGTAALGPSDSTDSGSDIQGGPGLNHDDGLTPPSGTTSDQDIDPERHATAGPDIGDANLDSDSDRMGTGERGAAGRDSAVPVDQQLHITGTDELVDPEMVAADASDDDNAEDNEDEA